MDFGINTSTRGAMSSRAAYQSVAKAAERFGYGFLSVNDHVVVPRDIASRYPYSEEGTWAGAAAGHNFDQLATLAFLAGCTEKIRLMTSVMVVPHRQPVLAAKMLSTIDVLSNGRLIVGCGAGWMKEEFEALETKPYEHRGSVTNEYIEAFRELWTSDAPEYHGDYVDFDNLMFVPQPLQDPAPPIWVGGESKAARRRAATLGDAWYPGTANPQYRLNTPERIKEAIADMRQMAEAAGRDPAEIDLAFVVLTPLAWEAQDNPQGDRRQLFTGSAEEMAEDVAALADCGVRHINLSLQAKSADETVANMQRFSEEVMPLCG